MKRRTLPEGFRWIQPDEFVRNTDKYMFSGGGVAHAVSGWANCDGQAAGPYMNGTDGAGYIRPYTKQALLATIQVVRESIAVKGHILDLTKFVRHANEALGELLRS